jgi:hypothetical protein
MGVADDIRELVDLLVNRFMPDHCMGRNDLAVASAFMLIAILSVKAHCRQTGEDFYEALAGVHEGALKIGLAEAEKEAFTVDSNNTQE